MYLEFALWNFVKTLFLNKWMSPLFLKLIKTNQVRDVGEMNFKNALIATSPNLKHTGQSTGRPQIVNFEVLMTYRKKEKLSRY
jgi:hypothetical protein